MGDLRTSAEMLSCGQASAPAVAVLRRHGARAITVPEAELVDAVRVLSAHDGLATTPSGAAGLAGAMAALADPSHTSDLGLDRSSRILVLLTECAWEDRT
ncbi:pyridoxal-phosphate dependent enzyme [Bradyrhizobium sp. 137]|nr:pyridoxal-phosphate dependent enzyme [Bradyrhizobium sp. 137]